MKRKIILSLCTIVLCFTLIVGVSYAAFKTINTYKDNTLTVSTVEMQSVLTSNEELNNEDSLDSLEMTINPGEEKTYYLHTKNVGTAVVDYRVVFTTTQNVNFQNLTITFNGEQIVYNYNRATTNWVTNVSLDESKANEIVFSLNQNGDELSNITFDIELQAIHTGLVEVDSTEDLSFLETFNCTQLQNNQTTLTINKDVYLDLNGKTVEELNIQGDIEFVEIVNGTINLLNINSKDSSVYLTDVKVTKGKINVGQLSVYYEEVLKTITENNQLVIYSGNIILDTTEKLDIKISGDNEEAGEVIVTTPKTTTITSLVIDETVSSKVVVQNSNQIENLTINNTSEVVLPTQIVEENDEVVYVSNTSGDTVYYTLDNTTYTATSTTLENLNYTLNDSLIYFFKTDLYEISDKLIVNNTTIFANNSTFVSTKEDVLFDVTQQVTIKDATISTQTTNTAFCGANVSTINLENTTVKGFHTVFHVFEGSTNNVNDSVFEDYTVYVLTNTLVDAIVSQSTSFHDVVVDDLNTTRYYTTNLFTSLQTAIDTLNANAVIHVVGGVYNDVYSSTRDYNLFITKALTIIGFEEATIKPSDDVELMPTIIVNAPNVILENLVIISTDSTYAVKIWALGTNTEVTGCTIYGNGILVSEDAVGCLIENNTIINSVVSIGLEVTEVANTLVLSNRCDGALVIFSGLNMNFKLESLPSFEGNVFTSAKFVALISIEDCDISINIPFDLEILEEQFWINLEIELAKHIDLKKLNEIILDLESVYNNTLSFEDFFNKNVDVEALYEKYLEEKVEELYNEYLELKELYNDFELEDLEGYDDVVGLYERYLELKELFEKEYTLEDLMNINPQIKESYEFYLEVEAQIELYLEIKDTLGNVIDFEALEKEIFIGLLTGEITLEEAYETYLDIKDQYEKFLELKDDILGDLEDDLFGWLGNKK